MTNDAATEKHKYKTKDSEGRKRSAFSLKMMKDEHSITNQPYDDMQQAATQAQAI